MTTPAYETRPTDELAHLAWCLLVALRIEVREGKTSSELQQHMFIMRWLGNAQKRKIFQRSVAPDIMWLQTQGKLYGVRANLRSKVEYIYRSSSGELAAQSDLYRFTCAVESMKSMGWDDHLVSDHEWQSVWASNTNISAFYTRKMGLSECFDDKQALIKPLELRLTGDTSGIIALFAQCSLKTEWRAEEKGFKVLVLKVMT